MPDSYTFRPAGGFSQRFTDAGEFAAALIGTAVQRLPLGNQEFDGVLRVLQLGDLVVQHATDGPHIDRGCITPGLAALIVPLAPPRASFINGTPIEAADVTLMPGGIEFASIVPVHLNWAAISLSLDQLDGLAELAGKAPWGREGVRTFRIAPDQAEHLIEALNAAVGLVGPSLETLCQPGVAEALAGSLRSQVSEALAGGAPRFGRKSTAMLRTVRHVEDFLNAHLARPIYTEELCAAVGISPRRLHEAFAAVLQTSPHAYLKALRLVMTQRELRRNGGLVKSVALAHGFWHLGRFSMEYRAMFGESPSETADRATRGT